MNQIHIVLKGKHGSFYISVSNLNKTLYFGRELFYQNLKEAVPSQRYVDAAIDYISCLLDVGPWEFSVLATSKGLVYGNMKVFTSKSESDFINCNAAGGKNV